MESNPNPFIKEHVVAVSTTTTAQTLPDTWELLDAMPERDDGAERVRVFDGTADDADPFAEMRTSWHPGRLLDGRKR
ncbi:hypothetical protein [Burkholderia thailandensis]|uniref:hypothetical protein n=1 Tax=Burkholderia thailandensis TaxID=57975 RepID=UPI00016A39C3|nr:hypothetical protein [Burkholderia thailandensis]AJT48797.1 hypothetical protein DR62_06950 [Burkholderia thailandensis]AOI51221.1 hypothetical protein WI24_04985 [Burkholderia thailandensis]